MGSEKSTNALRIGIVMAALAVPVTVASPATPQESPRKPITGAAKVEATPTADWAVQLRPGVDADEVASDLGFVNLGQIGTLEDYYLFHKPESTSFPAGFERDLAAVNQISDVLRADPNVLWSKQQIARQQFPRVDPTDPLFTDQWHLRNTGQSGGTVGEDANVVPAWDAGFTGAGVTVAIVDDGLQHTHGDFVNKYNPSASTDINGGDPDPSPGVGDDHGTSVGGVAAAGDDGAKCGVGSAHGSAISGIRLTSAVTTDAQEALAETYAYQINDVYNSSWGPADDGTLGAPGPLTQAALVDGVSNGRGGLGNIYVWAAGNGKASSDNVNYDGYANSIYTIAVGATDHNGVQSSYSEPGAPMLVNAGSSNGVGVTTTDLIGAAGMDPGDCRSNFGGTSSSSPLVAGVTALMLEAKPNLTWRDVQHLLVETAEKNDPIDGDWTTNGAGHDINHKYGFGRVDAAAAVTAAQSWALAPSATSTSSGTINVGVAIPDNDPTGVSDTFTVTNALAVEHVQVVFNATHTFRGDLVVTLTSPSGTESILAEQRLTDGNANYVDWTFMSVRHWDESSLGDWTLKVSDEDVTIAGTFDSWELIIHGTAANNDDFVAHQTISGGSGAVAGTNIGATKEGGEPAHAGNSGGASVWYRWTAPDDGDVTFDTSGSDFDTLLGVYTGNSVSTLTEVSSNDDRAPGGGDLTSEVQSVLVTAGTNYYIAVDGFNDLGVATGVLRLNWQFNPEVHIAHDVGFFDPSTGQWHLRDNATGLINTFFYGNPLDIPLVGDWNCDGTETVGLFRLSDAFFYLRFTNTVGIADLSFFAGNPDDVPLAGDFDGDGCGDVALYRPSTQQFFIFFSLPPDGGSLGFAPLSFLFGNPGDTPVVGDWDGDRRDEVGLHRESTGLFYWRNSLTTGIADGEIIFGDPGDLFVAGDWGTVDWTHTPAVFRGSDFTFYFKHDLNQGIADSQFLFGLPGWRPVAGIFGL